MTDPTLADLQAAAAASTDDTPDDRPSADDEQVCPCPGHGPVLCWGTSCRCPMHDGQQCDGVLSR